MIFGGWLVVIARTLEPSQLHSNWEANTAGYSGQTMLKSRGWQGNGHSLCNLIFDANLFLRKHLIAYLFLGENIEHSYKLKLERRCNNYFIHKFTSAQAHSFIYYLQDGPPPFSLKDFLKSWWKTFKYPQAIGEWSTYTLSLFCHILDWCMVWS